MNERERWIVYPLLFLALGVALRDKLVDRTTTKSIVCEELSIVDSSSGQVLVRLGRAEPHPGVPPTGVVMVDGVLETREFIWQRMPVLPIQVSPGVAVLGVLQGVAQAGAKLPNLNAPQSHPPAQPKPSTSSSPAKQNPVPPPSPAGEDTSEK